ncbi:MAG: hypothetical protein ABSB82_15525 [Terriglobia bacterium]
MGSIGRVAQNKIGAAKERCLALKSELRKLENKQYASPRAADILRKFIGAATESLLRFFDEESGNPDLELLEPRALELRIHRRCSLVPFLFEYLGLLERAEINETNAEVALALRRFVRQVLPNSEVLLRAATHLNYSITEVAKDIKELFSQTPFPDLANVLPEAFYVITVPPVEANEVLLNAMLTHEAGHGIYEQGNLADKILSSVEIPHELIKDWAAKITSQQEAEKDEKTKTLKIPFQEFELRELMTKDVTGTVTSWVAELSCDALAMRILGPAYFFAFVRFFSTVAMLDGASSSHPPPRLRLRLMFRYLQKAFNFAKLQPINDFMSEWGSIVETEISPGGILVSQLALNAISEKVISAIFEAADAAIPAELHYTDKDFVEDVEEVSPVLVENVPAVELIRQSPGSLPHPSFASILNSGWYILLARFNDFQRNLPENIGNDELASRRQLHMLLLKSLELVEIKLGWDEHSLKVGESDHAS